MEEKKKNQVNKTTKNNNNKKTAHKNTQNPKTSPKTKPTAQVKKNSGATPSKKNAPKVTKANLPKDNGSNSKMATNHPAKASTPAPKKQEEHKNTELKAKTKEEKKVTTSTKVSSPKPTPSPKKAPSKQPTSKVEKNDEPTKVAKKTAPKVALEPKKKEEVPKDENLTTEVPESSSQLEKTMIFDGTQRKNLEEVVNKLNEDNILLKDKVVKRSPVNRNIIIILIVAITITIISCIIYSVNYTQKAQAEDKNNTTIINTDNYNKIETIDGNNNSTSNDSSDDQIQYSNIKNITIDDFEVKIAEGENITALISSETCYFCVTFEPIANEVLKAQNQVAYRLDITSMSTEEVNRLRNYFAFTSTPTLLAIKNGAVAQATEGSLSTEKFTEWLKTNS